MVPLNRALIGIELFCFWYFLSAGPEPVVGQATFIAASVAAAWSIYNGFKWHFAKRDGEGLASYFRKLWIGGMRKAAYPFV